MTIKHLLCLTAVAAGCGLSGADACNDCKSYASKDLKILSAKGAYHSDIDSVILEIQVEGHAGGTIAREVGSMDGAHVLGYVFPTSLPSKAVGFGEVEGIVALALTSHPDFDDTPLWDENLDGRYDNDGVQWHAHWVVLTEDTRVAGGLAVKQFDPGTDKATLPPTAPGMPMYMDSPGYNIIAKEQIIRVVVPAIRIHRKVHFKFDAVTAFMKVNASNPDLPMLGVYEVYSIASGDLSLPYDIK